MYQAGSRAVETKRRNTSEGEKEQNKKIRPQNVSKLDSHAAKTLIVGYSPTGGGHTARTLNIVGHALDRGSLPEGSQVLFHIPPRWEGKDRPDLLNTIAEKILEKRNRVRFAVSDKPVYGYLDEKTGSSNDPEILRRIALHPLRNKERSVNNAFLNDYFPPGVAVQGNTLKDYEKGIDFDSVPRSSACNLIENVIEENKGEKNNIWILSDMDPGLQKAAQKHGIPAERRVDQQNHAILLDEKSVDSNVVLSNAVLAKVLDARGGMISHIALGGKNTLIDAHKTAVGLGIDAKTSLKERRNIINEVIFHAAISLGDSQLNTGDGYVLKGHKVSSPQDTDKVVYVYAHNKTSIIAEHVIKKLRAEEPAYSDKMYVFCGKNAIPGYNAMHLAYLTDADGITTAGAGTSGEFVWLHRHGGSEANLLILPIESHNEQEAIANCLQSEFPNSILRLGDKEELSSGKKIDELVERKRTNHADETAGSEKLMNAIGASGSYVEQAHDILFSHADLSNEMENFRIIEQKMYSDRDMKATRRYLKLYFQTTTAVSRSKSPFPIEISFKMNAGPAIIFNDEQEIKALFNDNTKMKDLINMSSETALNKLPLFKEVKQLMTTGDFTLHANDIAALDTQFGHRMTTGF